jgi:hypothetical protein
MGNTAFTMTVSGGANALLGVSVQQAASPFAVGSAVIYLDPNPANVVLLQGLSLGGAPGVPGAGSATIGLPLTIAPTPAL